MPPFRPEHVPDSLNPISIRVDDMGWVHLLIWGEPAGLSFSHDIAAGVVRPFCQLPFICDWMHRDYYLYAIGSKSRWTFFAARDAAEHPATLPGGAMSNIEVLRVLNFGSEQRLPHASSMLNGAIQKVVLDESGFGHGRLREVPDTAFMDGFTSVVRSSHHLNDAWEPAVITGVPIPVDD